MRSLVWRRIKLVALSLVASPLWQPLPPATPNPQPTKEGDSWNSN